MTKDLSTDLRQLTTIVCQGRALVDGQSVGEICGARFNTRRWGSLLDSARAAGWRIGRRVDGTPDAMCPDCAKPDPDTVKACRALARS